MPVIYDDAMPIAYPNSKSDELKNLPELYRFLSDGTLIRSDTLITHFRNNSFDLVKNLRGQHFFAIPALNEKGRVLLIPPAVLRAWYNNFINGQEFDAPPIPEAYHRYFTDQFNADEALDTDFSRLKNIRRAEHNKNPVLRQRVRESIPLPYKNVRHIGDNRDWLTAYSGNIIEKLNNNTFTWNNAEINGNQKRIAILEPNNKNGTALFITNTDLVEWYRNLLPRQQEAIPEIYRHYFENLCAQDHHLTRFTEIQNARITGPNNVVNPVDTNPPVNPNPHRFYQPPPIDYRFADIIPTAVAALAQLPQNRWEVGTTHHTGTDNQQYVTIKARDVGTLRQYQKGIEIDGTLTAQKAKMAASIAGTASHVLTICNDLNDITALVTFFHEALQLGKIPVVKPSTDRNAPPITQTMVLNAMANLIAYSAPNQTPQAKLEANFVAFGEDSADTRATYARVIPREPEQLNPDPNHNPPPHI